MFGLTNGHPYMLQKIFSDTERSLIITDFARIGIDISNTFLGCLKKSGELVKIGKEYSEDNCSSLCICTSNGTLCRAMCPDLTFDLLDCKLPYALKFAVSRAGLTLTVSAHELTAFSQV